MLALFRWLFGYVRFTYKNGFVEEFLNDCYKEGIELRDVKASQQFLTASCNLKYYKRLHKIALAHSGVTKINKKVGLPFILLPLKGRWGYFVGMLSFVIIISFLSSFVWRIDIVGNERVSDTTILAYLSNNSLHEGAMWSGVNRDELSWKMMGEFEDFSWVHINKIGTTAVVEVNERRLAPTPDFDKLEGKNVMRRELSVSVSRQQNNIVPIDKNSYYKINFFCLNIPLYFNKDSVEQNQKCEKRLSFNDVTLPIGLTRYDELFYTSSPVILNDGELKNLAKQRLSYMERDELDGFDIVNVVEHYDLTDESCVATFSYIIRRKQ